MYAGKNTSFKPSHLVNEFFFVILILGCTILEGLFILTQIFVLIHTYFYKNRSYDGKIFIPHFNLFFYI